MSIVYLRCKRHNREQKLPFKLLQVVTDDGGQRTARTLTESNGTLVKGAWYALARPFPDAIYCQHCLSEGDRTPLPIDPDDLPDLELSDKPILFQNPQEFSATATVKLFQDAFSRQVRYIVDLPATGPSYASNDILDRLHPDLRQAVIERILPENGVLYSFQADAIEAALDGNDTVVTTPTASGKTLTYTLPILDTLLRDANASALYLSPLVALTDDQLDFLTRFDISNTDWEAKGARFSIYQVCRTLLIGENSLTIARYDGGVIDGDRQSIRMQRPRYLLTTPDMLHLSILSGALDDRRWAYLLRGLRYVVIDEMHVYRGVLGASFSNLMRRLLRLCRVHGSVPQFLCASATVVDPADVVSKFIGRKPKVIDGSDSGAPRQRKQFVVWSGVTEDSTLAVSTQAKNVLVTLLQNRIRTIAFGRSIGEIYDIYRFVGGELRESGDRSIEIMPFMRELRRDEKRRIVRDLRDGRIHAVVSTTALSMGIDIGNLSASVIIGFPGSIATLWQEAGRAGRTGEGLVVLIADQGALDQFFVDHPHVLFDISAEPLYLNPDNPFIIRSHLAHAAREMPLHLSEITDFGVSAYQVVQQMVRDGMLVETEGGAMTLVPTPGGDNLAPFRNLGFSIDVQTENSHQTIVQVDAARAQRALHKYAHYQYIDKYYRVTRCDVDFAAQLGHILVQEIERPEFMTTAYVDRNVRIVQARTHQDFPRFSAEFGVVSSRTEVPGYYKVPLFSRTKPPEYQPLGRAAPPPLEFETQGYWLILEDLKWDHMHSMDVAPGLYSLAGAIRLATAVEELCDPSDIEAVATVEHVDTGKPTILIYDTVPGGVGISEAAIRRIESVIARALVILEHCPYCSKHPESRGCPHCVTAQYGDESTIDRHAAIVIGRAMTQ